MKISDMLIMCLRNLWRRKGRTLLTVTGGRIDDAQAVSKSLPDYFTLLNSLGAEAIIK